MDTAIHSVPHRTGAGSERVRPVPSAPDPHRHARSTTSPKPGGRPRFSPAATDAGSSDCPLQVPTTRLHLVAVDVNGVARLKLQPRFELVDGQRVVRHDGPPTYDAPPTVEDLFRDAARNHELEHTHRDGTHWSPRTASATPIATAARRSPRRSSPTPVSERWRTRAHADALLPGDRRRSRDVRRVHRRRAGARASAGGVSPVSGRPPRPEGAQPATPGRATRPARREDARHRRVGRHASDGGAAGTVRGRACCLWKKPSRR